MSGRRHELHEITDLRRIFTYDPEAGSILKRGQLATATDKDGYRVVTWQSRQYYVHRLAWALVHGRWPLQVDHANGDKGDNRLINLRECNHRTNAWNRGAQSNNKTGFKGVTWHIVKQAYRATIVTTTGQTTLGYFPTAAEAYAAYRAAERLFFGCFARNP